MRTTYVCVRCERERGTAHCGACNRRTVPVCSACCDVIDERAHGCTTNAAQNLLRSIFGLPDRAIQVALAAAA